MLPCPRAPGRAQESAGAAGPGVARLGVSSADNASLRPLWCWGRCWRAAGSVSCADALQGACPAPLLSASAPAPGRRLEGLVLGAGPLAPVGGVHKCVYTCVCPEPFAVVMVLAPSGTAGGLSEVFPKSWGKGEKWLQHFLGAPDLPGPGIFLAGTPCPLPAIPPVLGREVMEPCNRPVPP